MKQAARPCARPIWRQIDRADHIYRTAAELIWKHGYDATSMNDIAAAIGLTKAGLYHYIRDKEALLFGIMTYGMDELGERVIEPARAEPDPEQRLHLIVQNHLRMIIELGGAVTILTDEVAALTPAHQEIVAQRKRAYVDFVRDTLRRLRAERKLKDVDVTVAAFGLLGIMLWLPRWYRPEGRFSAEQVVDEITRMALGAVLRPSARLASTKSARGRRATAQRPDATRTSRDGQ